MIKPHLETLTVAAAGMAGAEAASYVPAEDVIKILVQIAIGIVTLVKMFKKPKNA